MLFVWLLAVVVAVVVVADVVVAVVAVVDVLVSYYVGREITAQGTAGPCDLVGGSLGCCVAVLLACSFACLLAGVR